MVVYNSCCFMNGAGNYYNSFIHLVSVNLVALGIRRRRAWQRLTRKRHFCFLRYKIFRFRQAQEFTALVGLSFYYFTKPCRFLRPRNIWAPASSPHASALFLIMIEITSRGFSIMRRMIMFQPWFAQCIVWCTEPCKCHLHVCILF